MREENQRIAFCTPDVAENHWPKGFGCASFGVTGQTWHETYSSAIVEFPLEIKGIRIEGTYGQIVENAAEAFRKSEIKAAIVLTANAGGENAFIAALSQALPKVLMIGGGAAANLNTNESGKVFPGGVQASVLLITDRFIELKHTYENIHDHIEGEYKAIIENPRHLTGLRSTSGVIEPAVCLKEKAQQIGMRDIEYEMITFSNKYGINVHLSQGNAGLSCGTDIEEELVLRWVNPKEVQQKIERFYDDNNSIIFGCAGLKGLLSEPVLTGKNSIGLFMFGEIMTILGKSHFGNLMLSKIKFNKKRI